MEGLPAHGGGADRVDPAGAVSFPPNANAALDPGVSAAQLLATREGHQTIDLFS